MSDPTKGQSHAASVRAAITEHKAAQGVGHLSTPAAPAGIFPAPKTGDIDLRALSPVGPLAPKDAVATASPVPPKMK